MTFLRGVGPYSLMMFPSPLLLALVLIVADFCTSLIAQELDFSVVNPLSQRSKQLSSSWRRPGKTSSKSSSPLIEMLQRRIAGLVDSDDESLERASKDVVDIRRTGLRNRRSGRLIGSCTSGPCLNGGTCRSTRFDEDSIGDETFKCECSPAYFGDKCEIDCRNGIWTMFEYHHVVGGYRQPNMKTLEQCQKICIDDPSCHSIEWDSAADVKCSTYPTKSTVASMVLHDTASYYTVIRCNEMCVTSPCLNKGYCVNLTSSSSSGVRCECADGYGGDRCQTDWGRRILVAINGFQIRADIGKSLEEQLASYATSMIPSQVRENMCRMTQCDHGGECVTDLTIPLGFRCNCAKEFYSYSCAYGPRDSPCRDAMCTNGGVCVKNDSNGNQLGYTCNCAPGFGGALCLYHDACASSPCLNGGICQTINVQRTTYSCFCVESVEGKRCEINWPRQLSMPFVEFSVNDDYRSSMFAQLESFGSKTLTDIQRRSMCKVERCLNGGTCLFDATKPLGYKCSCTNGYYGYSCHIGCHVDGSIWTTFLSRAVKGGGVSRSEASTLSDCLAQCLDKKSCTAVDWLPTMSTDAKCLSYTSDVTGAMVKQHSHTIYVLTRCTAKDDSPCYSQPCENGATCLKNTTDPHGYTCQCTTGYEGKTCNNPWYIRIQAIQPSTSNMKAFTDLINQMKPEMKSHMCVLEPCMFGQCVRNLSSVVAFNCACFPGSSGRLCENDPRRPCRTRPCLHGGVCIPTDDLLDPFRCNCSTGFHGNLCQYRSSCYSNPCQNGGYCVISASEPNDFECQCRIGSYGLSCESFKFTDLLTAAFTESDDKFGPVQMQTVSKQLCDEMTCLNGGTCVITLGYGIGYACKCPERVGGLNCEIVPGQSLKTSAILGCYRNSQSQLSSAVLIDQRINLAACALYCKGKYYRYGAVTKGNTCSCGSSFTRPSDESKECLTKCYGDQNSFCGGDDSKTVIIAIPKPALNSNDLSGRISRSEYDDDYDDVIDVSRRQIGKIQRDALAPPQSGIPVEKTGCASEPCHNGANCYVDAIVARGYSCRCRVGFYGSYCDHDAEACISQPCLNGAKCGKKLNDPKGYVCDCPVGFYGKQCNSQIASDAGIPPSHSDLPGHQPFSYYSIEMNPILKYVLYGLIAVSSFILIMSFLCCVDIRRDDWMHKHRLLYDYGLALTLPGVSIFSVAGSLFADVILCKWLYGGGHRTGFDMNAPGPAQHPASRHQVLPDDTESKSLLAHDEHMRTLQAQHDASQRRIHQLEHHINTLQHHDGVSHHPHSAITAPHRRSSAVVGSHVIQPHGHVEAGSHHGVVPSYAPQSFVAKQHDGVSHQPHGVTTAPHRRSSAVGGSHVIHHGAIPSYAPPHVVTKDDLGTSLPRRTAASSSTSRVRQKQHVTTASTTHHQHPVVPVAAVNQSTAHSSVNWHDVTAQHVGNVGRTNHVQIAPSHATPHHQ